MKRIFRRNQVIITTLAIMIAAAGYLNYSAKKEVAGSDVFEAGMMEISDEDILAENQAVNRADDGTLKEIQSLDGEFESAGSLDAEAGGETQAADSAGSSEPAGSETEAAGLENPEYRNTAHGKAYCPGHCDANKKHDKNVHTHQGGYKYRHIRKDIYKVIRSYFSNAVC